MPEPQTRLIVVALVVSARPPLSSAWRAGAWPDAGLEHLAHENFVDGVIGDAGALDRGADRDAAERRCRDVRERAAELADGRPRRGHDEDLAVGAAVKEISVTARMSNGPDAARPA